MVACDFNKGEVCKWTEESVPQFETRLGNDILKKMNDKDVIVTVAWNKLYHRKFFDEYGLRYPEGKIHEDMFLTPQVLRLADKMVITSQKLYFYRQRENSIMSADFSLKQLDGLEAIRFRIKLFEKWNELQLWQKEYESLIRKSRYLYKKMKDTIYADECKKIRNEMKSTIRAAYHWITARVWVDNIKSTIRPPKRKGQYYIQTWHSTLGFKKNEEDAENLPIRYIEQAKADGKQIDLMYSDNDFRCDKYRNHFWYSGEVLKCDVPRTGALLKENKMRINKVYCELKVNPKRKIVLYAPTFRKNVDKTVYYVNADAICKMLEKKFGESFTFALRLHPNNADIADEIAKEMNVVNATKYPDMQELLVASAVLITDYSGCMFDFGFARKPVFLLAKDVERYIKEERKWYFGLDEVPFTLSRSEKELCESVEKFDKEEYKHQCEIFEKKIGFSDSGNGAKIIADRIVDQMRRSL